VSRGQRDGSLWTYEHILLSLFFTLSQPGGPCFCIYFPQEHGRLVVSPTIKFSAQVSRKIVSLYLNRNRIASKGNISLRILRVT
jgi:hypothetical protein